MIRIWRGEEPPDLAKARRRYLARACLAWAQRQPIAFDGYQVARTPLYHAQYGKCAYCERQQGLDNQPVEHFRPKGGAERDPDDPFDIDEHHYFWLAWSWENLFFSCGSCNGPGIKGNLFPLLVPSTMLPVPPRVLERTWPREHFDREREKAMLVDPSREDPMDFIQWSPQNPDADWKNLRWIPMNRDPEKRGDATIDILGLRQDLPEQVSANIRVHIVPKMTKLQAYWNAGDRQRAVDVWDDVEKIFDAGMPYLAATYDALEWFLEQMGLTDLHAFIGRNLNALRPGAREDEIPSVDIPDHSACASLPVDLVLRIRAEQWTADNAVLALCSHTAWDDIAILAQVLGYAESTVYGAAMALVREGRIQRLKTGGFGPVTP